MTTIQDMATMSNAQLEDQNEADLDAFIMSKQGTDDARFVLGRLMIEGSSDLVTKNVSKGLNWLKEAVKKGHMPSVEYKTYWDIRFDKNPSLESIKANLEEAVRVGHSTRAANTLAELNHASSGGNAESLAKLTEEARTAAIAAKGIAAQYYMISAEKGDVVGTHWIGVFYHEGFGVTKNVEKAITFLEKAAEQGNGQSYYQLYLIRSGKDGQDKKYKNIEKAYEYLMKAMIYGVTYWDELVSFFKANYKALAPVFVKSKNLPVEIKNETEKDVISMHEAFINEMKKGFSSALSKDRLYHRPCGFINDQQIWMVGVQIQYFLDTVLNYDHKDFIKAIKIDLGPVLGDLGLWSLNNLLELAKARKDNDLKKKYAVMIDIVEKYLDGGLQILGVEKKYYFANKYGPKKCPDAQKKRGDQQHLYSWSHFAPQPWYDHVYKDDIAVRKVVPTAQVIGKLCSKCGSQEGGKIKHKVCSACKTRFYCSIDCQRQDWKNGHNKQCKAIQAQQKANKI